MNIFRSLIPQVDILQKSQFLASNEYFITFNNKMIKSRSFSSDLTKPSSTQRHSSPLIKFNHQQASKVHMLVNPFNNPYPLKFPKRLLHKATTMNMLTQTQEVDRKYCLKTDRNAHRVTMFEDCITKRSLKAGEFSHLTSQSPLKPINQRSFQELGITMNRKRINQAQYNSVSMLASISQNIENIGAQKFVKNVQKKHYKVGCQAKKQLQWIDKPNKQKFQMKYRKAGQQGLKQKNIQTNTYSSIHLKYTGHK